MHSPKLVFRQMNDRTKEILDMPSIANRLKMQSQIFYTLCHKWFNIAELANLSCKYHVARYMK